MRLVFLVGHRAWARARSRLRFECLPSAAWLDGDVHGGYERHDMALQQNRTQFEIVEAIAVLL